MNESDADRPTPAQLEAITRRVVSPRTGLFRSLRVQSPWPDDGPMTNILVTMADFRLLPGGGTVLATAGSHLDPHLAYTAALFESIERYCAAFIDDRRLVRGKAAALPEAVHGERLPLFAAFQYAQPGWPYRALDPGAEIRWVEGRSLVDGRRRLLPASLIHIPFAPRSPDECIGPCTSTGMACAPSWEHACLTGLLEVCERDAFMIMWMNRLSLPRIRVVSGSALARDMARALGGRGHVTFVNLSNDLRVPTVLAVLRSEHRGAPLVSLGTASKPTFESAARKALLEALREASRLRRVLAAPGPRWLPSEDFSNVVDFEWHSLVYADPALQSHLSFMTAGEELPVDDTLEARGSAGQMLPLFVERIARRGEEPIAVELTTRDIEELGVHAVKVMIPGAVPMSPDHRFPWLGHERLYKVPHVLGLRERDASVAELNLRVPHPFA